MLRNLTAAVAAALTSVVMLAPSGAMAGNSDEVSRVVLQDGRGDVLRWVPEDQAYVSAVRPEADVVRAQVAHRPRAVRVRMRFADLRRYGGQHDVEAEIRTPEGWYGSTVITTPGNRRGRVFLVNYEREARVRCETQTFRVDYTQDVVTMRIPRACIGRPAWVRVSLTSHVEVWQEATAYVDNPHTRRLRPAFTPRLFRGMT